MIRFLKSLINLCNPYEKRDFNSLEYCFLRVLNNFLNYFIFKIFKTFNLKLLPIPAEAIGHQIFDIECFLYEQKKKKLKFTPVITGGYNYIANHFLFNNFQINRINFIIVRNRFLCMLLFFQRNYKNITYDTFKYQVTRDFRTMFTIFKKKPFCYKLDRTQTKLAEKIIKDLRIDIKKDFVIIHARDSSYKKYDGESYRNSEIENFKNAVYWLKRKGLQIIRIGNTGMKKCSYENQIIDVTTLNLSREKKEVLDLYFIDQCKFLIGSASGPYLMASAFNKPMLLVDMAPLGNIFPCAKKAIALPKLYRNKSNGKLINFKVVLEYNFSHYRLDSEFELSGINLKNNSQKEILDATKEIFYRVKNNNFRENFIQRKFKKIFNKKIHDSANSSTSISSTFINKYKNLL